MYRHQKDVTGAQVPRLPLHRMRLEMQDISYLRAERMEVRQMEMQRHVQMLLQSDASRMEAIRRHHLIGNLIVKKAMTSTLTILQNGRHQHGLQTVTVHTPEIMSAYQTVCSGLP